MIFFNISAMKIHVSHSCKQALDEFGTFVCSPRGAIEVKGKGEMYTFWLVGTKERKASVVAPVTGASQQVELEAGSGTTVGSTQVTQLTQETMEPAAPEAWS